MNTRNYSSNVRFVAFLFPFLPLSFLNSFRINSARLCNVTIAGLTRKFFTVPSSAGGNSRLNRHKVGLQDNAISGAVPCRRNIRESAGRGQHERGVRSRPKKKCTMASGFREGRSLLRQLDLILIPLERNGPPGSCCRLRNEMRACIADLHGIPEVRKRCHCRGAEQRIGSLETYD